MLSSTRPSGSGRRRRLVGLAAGVVALTSVLPALGSGVSAAGTSTVKFSQSTIRPGETVKFVLRIAPPGAAACFFLNGQVAGCNAFPAADEPFKVSLTFDELAASPDTKRYEMRLFSPEQVENLPDLDALLDMTPMSAAKLKVVFAPGAPSVVSLTRGSGKVAVVAAPSSKVYGPEVTQYQARCVSKAGTYLSAPSDDPRMAVTGLPNQVDFTCSTRAKNAKGWSIWGATRHITTSSLAPQPPTAAKVETVTAGTLQATVQLARPDQRRGGTITGYQAQCVNGDTVKTSDVKPGKRHVVTGLTGGEEWSCSGRARNRAGWGPWSKTTDVTPLAPNP